MDDEFVTLDNIRNALGGWHHQWRQCLKTELLASGGDRDGLVIWREAAYRSRRILDLESILLSWRSRRWLT